MAGAAYVPLDSAMPPERLRYMASDSRIALLVTADHAAASWCDVPVIDPGRVDEQAETDKRWEATQPSDLAYVMYTSGSTGQAQGRGGNPRQRHQPPVEHEGPTRPR